MLGFISPHKGFDKLKSKQKRFIDKSIRYLILERNYSYLEKDEIIKKVILSQPYAHLINSIFIIFVRI